MANDAQFFAPGSDEASYKPAAGDVLPDPVRVIRFSPDMDVVFGDGTRIIEGTNVLLIRRSEVAQPAKGDLVAIGAVRFRLQGNAMLDGERLNWRIGATEA